MVNDKYSGRLLTANFTQLWQRYRFTDFRRRKLSHNVQRRNFRTPKIWKNLQLLLRLSYRTRNGKGILIPV